MRYLVTGADGFLGRHFLAKLARQGAPVRAMLIAPTEARLPGDPPRVVADLLRPATLAPAVEGVSDIIHLAARVHMMHETAADPEKAFHEVNVAGTLNLLRAAAQAGAKRFLLMSSVKAMGEEETGEFDESSPCQPETPYGRSKLHAEQAVFDFARSGGLHAVVLRLPMVYGPGNKGNMLRLLEAARQGRRLPIGAVRNRRSMVYVGNVVDATLAALAHPASAGQVYLVCDRRPYNTGELYAAICRAMGRPPMLRNVPVALLKAAGLCGSALQALLRRDMPINRAVVQRLTGDLCFRAEKIRDQLGFAPAVELDEGVAVTVAWFNQGCPPTPRD